MPLAARHRDDRELETGDAGTETNDLEPFAEDAFETESIQGMACLEALDFGAVFDLFRGGFETKCGRNGFECGLFTNRHRAALVGVFSGELCLAFRGTNDSEGQAGVQATTGIADPRDEKFWPGILGTKADRYDLSKPPTDAFHNDAAESGIAQIRRTGHSLGRRWSRAT